MLSRRVALFAGVGAAVSLVAGCGAEGADKTPVLNVGSQKGGTKSVMLASGALDGAPYRISWSEFPAAQHLLEGISSGAVDVGLVGDAPFQFAWQSGAPIRAIGAQTTTGERPDEALAIIVRQGSNARTLADLRGKSIATTRGSVGHYLVLRGLAAAGLPLDAVRLTFLAPGDATAAFASGSVDAWATWTPYLTVALREGARVIVDARAFPPSYGFNVANTAAIEGKRALLQDFLKREAKALTWSKQHPDQFAAVLARETGLPADIADTMVRKNGRVAVPINDSAIAAQREVADLFTKSGAPASSRPIEEGFDKSFLDR